MAKTHFEAVAHRQDDSFALASSSLTGRIWDGAVWVFSSMQEFQQCPNLNMVSTKTPAGVSDMLWLSNDHLLLASDSGELEIWNCHPPGNTLEHEISLGSHDNMVLCLSKLAGESKIISGGAEGKVIVWDTESQSLVKSFRGHTDMVLSVAGDPQNKDCFITTSQDGTVRMWDLRKPKPARKLTACKNGVHTSVAWCSTEEHTLALGSELGKVDIVDTRETEFLFARYHPHTRAVHRLGFAPWNSSLLASVSDDNTVCVLSIPTGKNVFRNQSHADFVHGLSWHPSENQLVTCAWDGQVLEHTIQSDDISGTENTSGTSNGDECRITEDSVAMETSNTNHDESEDR